MRNEQRETGRNTTDTYIPIYTCIVRFAGVITIVRQWCYVTMYTYNTVNPCLKSETCQPCMVKKLITDEMKENYINLDVTECVFWTPE